MPTRILRPRADLTSKVLTRWRGMGGILGVAFFSLFIAAHHQFTYSPAYLSDGMLFGARTHSVFTDLTSGMDDSHRHIGAEHPAFTLLHHAPARLLVAGLKLVQQPENYARKHGVALLTCGAGALSVIMIYHALLWCGLPWVRAALFAAVYGAGTAVWIVAALPEVWIFAGLGVAAVTTTTARGDMAPWWLHVLSASYAVGCFIGSIVPVLLLSLARCAQDTGGRQRLTARPLLWSLVALPVVFALANMQRQIYPQSDPLPLHKLWDGSMVRLDAAAWTPARDTAGRTAREVFLSNFIAPRAMIRNGGEGSRGQRKIQFEEAAWSRLDLQKGLASGWFLLLALALAGLVWRAQFDACTLGILAALMWSVAALPVYGTQERLLLYSSLWTPLILVATALGVERSLEHWRRLTAPVTILLVCFLTAQICRNWWFITEVARM